MTTLRRAVVVCRIGCDSYLSGQDVREAPVWQAITWIADLVTATGTFDGGP